MKKQQVQFFIKATKLMQKHLEMATSVNECQVIMAQGRVHILKFIKTQITNNKGNK